MADEARFAGIPHGRGKPAGGGLERLVDDYDERQVAGRLQPLEPHALLAHLMEEANLKQVDLVDCFGSQSVVSAVMAGKRRINMQHARRLSQRFGLPMAMFIR